MDCMVCVTAAEKSVRGRIRHKTGMKKDASERKRLDSSRKLEKNYCSFSIASSLPLNSHRMTPKPITIRPVIP